MYSTCSVKFKIDFKVFNGEFRCEFKTIEDLVMNARKCIYCSFQTASNLVLLRHSYAHEKFQCDHCNCVFLSKDSLEQHKAILHTLPRAKAWFACHFCAFKYKYEKSLENHIDLVHSEDRQRLKQCTICDYKSFYKYQMKAHIAETHFTSTNDNTWLTCEHCDYDTNTQDFLEAHMRNKHSNAVNTDSKRASFNYQFIENQRLDHSVLKPERTFKYNDERPDTGTWLECNICQYSTNTYASYQQHLLAKHADKTTFRCPLCDFKTLYKKSLSFHLFSKHNQGTRKSFHCDHCDYKSLSVHALRKHALHKHASEEYVQK